MARRTRFHQSSAIYHVMLRGNDGQNIFFSNDDKCFMCLLMQEGIQRFGHLIHSFCFMDNHIHLAIQVGEISISHIMQNLAFRYTRYINKKYKRVGHLFQGRFKSIIVDGSVYLKELIRYIHLNPVRAQIVNFPEKYVWSSHRAYLKLDDYSWLTSDYVLKNFGNDRKEAIDEYQNYVLNGIGIETTLNFKSGCSDGILGGEEFIDIFLGSIETNQKKREIKLLELIEKVCKRFDIAENLSRLPTNARKESHVRGVFALLIREIDNLSIEELAVFLNRDPSGLSKLATRLEKKCFEFPSVATEIGELRKWIHISDLQMSECHA